MWRSSGFYLREGILEFPGEVCWFRKIRERSEWLNEEIRRVVEKKKGRILE